jgi:hypothetical protein
MPDDAIRPPGDPSGPADLSRRPPRAADDRIRPDEGAREKGGRRPSRVEPDEGGPQATGGWGMFARGVDCVRTAVVVVLVTFLAGVAWSFLGISPEDRDNYRITNLLLLLGLLCAGLNGFVGLCLLCAVPAETRLKPLAFVTFFAVCVALFLAGVVLSTRPGPDDPLLSLLLVLTALVLLAGYVCHCLLLGGAARQFGDDSLARGFIAYLIVSILGSLVRFILGVASSGPAFSVGEAEGLGTGLRWAVRTYALVMLLWAHVLLGRLLGCCYRPARAAPLDDAGSAP